MHKGVWWWLVDKARIELYTFVGTYFFCASTA